MGTTDSFHPGKTRVPHHVGLIPDGGRRWAQANGCSLADSYNRTKQLIRDMVVFFTESGVFEISIYLSSIQNFRRLTFEVEAFNQVSTFAFQHDILNLAYERQLRINVVGSRNAIPYDYLKAIEAAELETKSYKQGQINILVAYNPIDEVIGAFSKSENSDEFLQHLWVTNPLDLIIRSGGANLLSNFLPLQSGYARLVFFDRLFNDLTIRDLEQVFWDFTNIERKFGD